MSDRLVRLLGLGLRARSVIVGVAGVRAALGRGRLRCVVVARDASARTRDKVAPLARARRVPLIEGPAAAVLGARLGRPTVQAVGVRDAALARGLVEAFGGVRGHNADS